MMETDIELKRLLQNARKGSKSSYEDFCDLIFDSLYSLAVLLFEEEGTSEDAVRDVLGKLAGQLLAWDGKEDPLQWTSRFATAEFYHRYCSLYGDVFSDDPDGKEYVFDSMEEDLELSACAVQYNQFFTNKRKAVKLRGLFENLTKGQIILYQLFCYERCSLEEIEDLLEVDSSYFGSELESLRDVLLYGRKSRTAQAATEEEPLRTAQEDEVAELEEVEEDAEDTDNPPVFAFVPARVLKALSLTLPAVAVVLLAVIVAVVSGNRKADSGRNPAGGNTVATSGAAAVSTAAETRPAKTVPATADPKPENQGGAQTTTAVPKKTAAPPTQPGATETEPTTPEPTGTEPVTGEPTTAEPTSAEPTTAEPVTEQTTTAEPDSTAGGDSRPEPPAGETENSGGEI